MKRMGMLDRQMTMVAKNIYDSIFVGQLNPSHAEAMRELFPDPTEERGRRRASKRV